MPRAAAPSPWGADVVLFAVLVWHLVVALAAGLLGRRMGRSVLLLGALAPAVALAASVALTGGALEGEVLRTSLAWVPGMDLTIELALDGFALLFWWVISGIGVLVMLYASRYFGQRDDLGRFTALLVTFAGAMLLLTSSDNVLGLFVAWELTSITSYLLIGFEDDKAAARSSALQALLVTGAGGLALLGGLVLLAQAAGTYQLSALLEAAPGGVAAEVGLALVLLGAMTKSAQVPFHFWLPGAMSAPTPVSAYLHSATMVKAGIYLLARFAPAFAPEVAWWTPTLLAVGGVTMLLGGYRALHATDLKALLAYGTVSQLGFIVLLVGHGDPELLFAGVAVLVAHALFKATLFLSVGVVDHQAHTRDLRRLDGVGRALPVTAVAATIATASMAGVIPLLGFVSKEAALEAAIHLDSGTVLVAALITVGSVLTTAYGIRFVWGAFLRKPAGSHPEPVTAADVPAPKRSFEAPAALLAGLTVVLGPLLAPVDALVSLGATSLEPAADEFHLLLWHGFGPSLYLSLTALAGGYLLYRLPRLVTAAGRVTSRAPDMLDVYAAALRGLNRSADRTVSVVQPGSLPVYLGIILLTAVVLPLPMLLSAGAPQIAEFADSPIQVVVVGLVMAAALGAALVRRRLSAVLLLGGVGFSVAVLFVLQGAPDLALTQLLVETLSLGIFVLVLRRLPEEFEASTWRFGNGLRVAVSATVGVFVAGFALIAAGGRTGGTNAAEFLARAEPDGGGKNVVNVILTDFRALDTLGEITVLLVAAIGVVAIVRGGRDDDQGVDLEPPTAGDPASGDPASGDPTAGDPAAADVPEEVAR